MFMYIFFLLLEKLQKVIYLTDSVFLIYLNAVYHISCGCFSNCFTLYNYPLQIEMQSV